MFGERIRELRIDKNLSQEELGALLNKSKNNISQYEAEKRSPDLDTLKKLCDLFGCTLDYLLGRSNQKSGRLLKVEELETFLPKDYLKDYPLKIEVEGQEVTEEIKQEIIQILKEKGHLSKFLKSE